MGQLCSNALRERWDGYVDRCSRFFPCLSDPARRSALALKVALVMLHVIIVGVLFVIGDMIERTKQHPWHMSVYFFLFAATLAQYFLTSLSSPGYVIDAMRAFGENEALVRKASPTSKQPASSKNGNVVITVDQDCLGRNLLVPNANTWSKIVMDLYPPGTPIRTWTCSYCNVLQPPRTKHCHDCDKCVLQFDHHCGWLGACIGQANHCRFWWYILEETALCLWTGILYISYLGANISKAWWVDVIMIFLLIILFITLMFLVLLLLFHSYLILTNQTTYELVRRRRIPYMRGIPDRVFPFSRGLCRNLYYYCCSSSSLDKLERLPTGPELEEKSRPYTCYDALSCRCCCY